MSTKTSIKRIALVAVAALGFGMVSTISAHAAAGGLFTSAQVAAIDITKPVTATAGSTAAFTIKSSTGAVVTQDGTVADSWLIRAAITSAPVGGISQFTGATTVATIIRAGQGSGLASGAGQLGASLTATGATVANTLYTLGTMTFTPSKAGTYVISFYHDANNDGILGNGEMYQTVSLTVGSTNSGLTEFSNAATATASSAADLVGIIVPAVGATVVETSGRVANLVGFAPKFTLKRNAGHAGTSADTNTGKATLVYSVTNPAGAAVSVVDAKVAGVASTTQYVPGNGTITTTASASTTVATPFVGSTVYFNPATAGTYTITVFHDANADGLLSVGEASGTQPVVVAADALPSITFTKYGSNTTAAQSADGLWGQLVKISLRNGTTPWSLAANESLVLTSAASTTDFLAYTTWTSGTAAFTDVASGISTLTLTSANFNGNGDAWINVGDTTAAGGTFSVSAVISGGTANGASGSFTITTIDTDTSTPSATAYTLVGNGANGFTNANTGAGVSGSTLAAGGANNQTWSIKSGVATSVSAKTVAGANNYKLYNALYTDTLGLVTGVAGAKFNVNAVTPTTGAVSTTTVSLGVSIPATTAGLVSGTTVGTLLLDKDTDGTITITANSAAVASVAVDPTDLVTTTWSVRSAAAGTNKFTATVLDQFGNAVVGAAVTAQVTAGRNIQAVATSLVSDANGQVSFTVTDAYTGTLATTDTIDFKSNGYTGTVTVSYGTYNAPSTVTITGGASADVAPTVTYNYITTAVAGADATTVKMTATVKDANGATLPAGIKVTWSISGIANAAILKDSTTGYDWATSYTDSNGQAVTYVYAWGTGDVSVSATAGAVTSATAGTIHFANAAADARVLSATTEGGVVKAKVVDRYGNPVAGVSVTATRVSGTGYFGGSGASSAAAETGTDGTVDFVIQGGSAVVDVKTTTLNAGQTSSASGYVGATAVTATGVGASFAPAGVQSVKGLDVAGTTPTSDAIDAANEATDAANAATDAANAAAEAADAATAAAQDAQAAVAALATEVAAMISGIKAQIIRLTNLVVKIQKKVKA